MVNFSDDSPENQAKVESLLRYLRKKNNYLGTYGAGTAYPLGWINQEMRRNIEAEQREYAEKPEAPKRDEEIYNFFAINRTETGDPAPTTPNHQQPKPADGYPPHWLKHPGITD